MKLGLDRILDAAMATFAETGHDGMSMRKVADRLDAQAGSLYYYVRNKDELVRLLADRICQQAVDQGTQSLAALPNDATWTDRVTAQLTALRVVLLTHRGGALVLARSPGVLSQPALTLMERLLSTMSDGALEAGTASLLADTLLAYVTGYVLQEQSAAENIPHADPTTLLQHFPLVAASAGELDSDAQFARAVNLICAASVIS